MHNFKYNLFLKRSQSHLVHTQFQTKLNCCIFIHELLYQLKITKIWQNIMKKQKFSFVDPDFEQQSSDEEQYLPASSLRQYNKQYSFIIRKAQQFFRDCKTCVEKFAALNQFGIGLNLNHLMSVFSKMQRNVISNEKSNQSNIKQKLKDQYELSFHQILDQMQNCIRDFLQYEKNFKMQYFGQIKRRNSIITPDKNQSPIRKYYSNQKNHLKSPSSYSSIRQREQGYQIDDSRIRQILTQKLNPKKQQISIAFNIQKGYTENIESIEKKVDQMIENINGRKKKQEAIIKIFNENRFQNTLQARKSKIDSNYKTKKQQVLNRARMMIKGQDFEYTTADNSYQYTK